MKKQLQKYHRKKKQNLFFSLEPSIMITHRTEQRVKSEPNKRREQNKMPKVAKKKSGGKKSVHICAYCDKVWPSPSRLETHRRVHTGERPFPCNLCSYSATQKNTLQSHIKSHLQEKLLKCPEPFCNYSAVAKTGVKTHKWVHTGEKPHSCPLCSFKTGWKSNLTAHLKTHEENRAKPFQCELCPFKTTTHPNLKTHMTHVHSTGKSVKCEEKGCDYAGKTKTLLSQHAQTHKEKRLSCSSPNCGYTTNWKSALSQHMSSHSEDKKYKCRICEYTTHYSAALNAHMRTHTKERPYKCQIPGCSYETRWSGTLNRHLSKFHQGALHS